MIFIKKIVVVGPSYIDHTCTIDSPIIQEDHKRQWVKQFLEEHRTMTVDDVIAKIENNGFRLPDLPLGHSLKAQTKKSLPGGTGLSYGVAMALLGFDTTLCSAIGGDGEGRHIQHYTSQDYIFDALGTSPHSEAILRKYGLQHKADIHNAADPERGNKLKTYFQAFHDTSSDSTHATISPHNDRFIVSRRAASERLALDEQTKKYIDEADAVIVTTMTPQKVKETIDYARNKYVVLAMNLRNAQAAGELSDVIDHVDYIPLDWLELKHMSKSLGDKKVKQGKLVAVTNGPHGGAVYMNGEPYDFECVPECIAQPTDTNHAGEAFGSGFFYGLYGRGNGTEITEAKIMDAAAFGAMHACLNIQKEGIGFAHRHVLEQLYEKLDCQCYQPVQASMDHRQLSN
ncbi:carbohydrate kinase family protein [Candidatus Woesearchaeota archaeon]|nr:carbohydrate kinase family protein [Candidatus Woesearchaeota archaeon]